MKRLQYLTYITVAGIFFPAVAKGSSTGGGAIAAQIDAVSKIEMFTEFFSGQLLLAVGSLSLIVVGISMLMTKANDSTAWDRAKKIALGLIVASSAVGVMQAVFGGATL